MSESKHTFCESGLTQIEPEDRLVVLARTIQTRGSLAEAVLKDRAVDCARFGEACLGQAVYRHRSIFQNASEASVWSHFELSYFRNVVPEDAIFELVVKSQPDDIQLLRAEILLTTPSSFLLPPDWKGLSGRPEWQASMEYIDVDSAHLDEYRDVMRDYCGPAAAKLVGANKVGTFRAMETVVVLYRDPEFSIDWNQVHLCELDADGFNGFGQAFQAALRDDSPDGAEIADVFADLDRIRTVSRWTFNHPVLEADLAVGREGKAQPLAEPDVEDFYPG
jgi:hypothetical protein